MRCFISLIRHVRSGGCLIASVAALLVTSGCSNDSGLPTEFGDCASWPCEVALEAFTTNPDRLPYCESRRDDVELSCPTSSESQLFAGTCDEYWAVRHVYYAFTGDFYECIYDATQGVLVGAKWSPDNHPTQFAGVQLPTSCTLYDVCDTSDLTSSE